MKQNKRKWLSLGLMIALSVSGMMLFASCKSSDDENYEKVALTNRITHLQPMTGMVLWNDQAAAMNNTHGQCISLEFAYIPPCKLVTGKANGKLQYDWTYL